VAKDLIALTRKDVPFQWGEKEQKSFDKIKKLMCSDTVLAHPNPDKPFILEMDCSDYTMGATLSQWQTKDEKEVLHPVGYFSSTLSPAERNYAAYSKELLAIV
jgi:hypothetical protein